jgi:capsular exopolysaccharide synthesis family protein
MSRIHDALKRAEHERSIYKGVGAQEVEPPVAIPPARAIPASPAAEAPHLKAIPHVPAPNPVAIERELANCPKTTWKPDTRTMLFFGPDEQAPGTEEFRTLRSQLYQLREKQPLQKILITSSVPEEGRSFVAANLAQVMACQPACRVLLIDADLRNPGLHVALGTHATAGLSEYLLGETDNLEIIQRGQMENLLFIPAGRRVSGQSEILSTGRLRTLLDRVASLFDWIIIDSPASLPVSDSGLIANSCDGVLMVVRSNSTPFDLVRKAQQKLNEQAILGVVLNGIPTELDPRIRHRYSDSLNETEG